MSTETGDIFESSGKKNSTRHQWNSTGWNGMLVHLLLELVILARANMDVAPGLEAAVDILARTMVLNSLF